MNNIIEHDIFIVTRQLEMLKPGCHCLLLGKYDYTLKEERYSSVMDMTVRNSMALFPTRDMDGFKDREVSCCCTYYVDRDCPRNRDKALKAMASHFVTQIMPRLEFKYKKLVYEYDIDRILSVLD